MIALLCLLLAWTPKRPTLNVSSLPGRREG
jgi:hypothetical protein